VRRRDRGRYELTVQAGTHSLTGFVRNRVCRFGAVDGPEVAEVTALPGDVIHLDVFCGRH
jgi:hypothetical protein